MAHELLIKAMKNVVTGGATVYSATFALNELLSAVEDAFDCSIRPYGDCRFGGQGLEKNGIYLELYYGYVMDEVGEELTRDEVAAAWADIPESMRDFMEMLESFEDSWRRLNRICEADVFSVIPGDLLEEVTEVYLAGLRVLAELQEEGRD